MCNLFLYENETKVFDKLGEFTIFEVVFFLDDIINITDHLTYLLTIFMIRFCG